MKIGLKIDLINIHPIDIHRLPQHPVYQRGIKVTRPIIIKLTDTFEKQLIMNSLGKLKAYNSATKTENISSRQNVYVSEHLPQAFRQKEKLMPQFKEARKEKKATC